jgi:hypothetical protein
MTSNFSFPRLLKLIQKQGVENSRLYLLSSLALIVMLALVFAFWVSLSAPDYGEEVTWIIFLFGLFISGSVFASTTFNMLGNKDKGVYWLGFPASHLEKLICSLFYTTIVFSVVYAASFFLVKSAAIIIIKEIIASHPGYKLMPLRTDENSIMTVLPYFIYGFYAVQAIYLLGSIYFSRFSFIITTIIGAALIFCFVYYMYRISEMFSHYNWKILSATSFNNEGTFTPGGPNKLYSVSHLTQDIILCFVKFGWAPIFWVITWYRLKEKEI